MVDKTFWWTTSSQMITCLLIIILFLFYSVNKIRKKNRVRQWQKLLNLQTHFPTFQKLYKDVDGFALSRQARQQLDAIEYVYGEIEFLSFIALLSLVKPDRNTVFYDLGSGTGKAVIACAMVYPVKKSVGIELFPELVSCANSQIKNLTRIPSYVHQTKKIIFILDNFLTADLSDATLIFINSSTFFNPTWIKLCARLDTLPNLNSVITTSKPLISSKFSPIISTKMQMSWGTVLAYIHSRKTNFH